MHRIAAWRAATAAIAASLIVLTVFAAAANDLATELRDFLERGAVDAGGEAYETDLVLLTGFYEARGMAPLWVTPAGVTANGRALAAALSAARDDGLDPDDYGAAANVALLGATSPALLAELEARLSLGLMGFAQDLGAGRLQPSEVDPELFVYPQDVDPAGVLAAAAAGDDVAALVERYRPAHPTYRRLRATLTGYRALARVGGWPRVPTGPTLKPGMADPRVAALRARLRAERDLVSDDDAAESAGDPALYDPALEAAVRRFQGRHGLEVDGLVGPATLKALNVSVAGRVDQILLNMERRRWMPDDLPARYIQVNLADFALKLVTAERTVFVSRVVVGRPYHRTPVFLEEMTYLVVNPYWNVPNSIARKELLPKIKADPGYLAAHNYDLLDGWSAEARHVDPQNVDWSAMTARNFPYRLRQGPGEGNALGRLKFMFPNRFSVYIHDTPARSLFNRPNRAFSHGCIRVEQPSALAAVVLEGQNGWTLDDVETQVASGERRIVRLDRPLMVGITYLTAWVNKDGTVHFRNDVYGRDARLAEALLGPRVRGRRR